MAKYAKPRKRKSSKKKTTYRRRRVGATKGILNPNSPVLMIASAAAGYFLLADTVNPMLDKVVPASFQANENYEMIAGAVEAGGGLALAMLPKKKTVATQALGGVLIGIGLKRVMSKVGVGGFRDIPAVGATRKRMAGFRDIPAVGSFNPLRSDGKLGAFNPLSSSNRSLGSVNPNAGANAAGCF